MKKFASSDRRFQSVVKKQNSHNRASRERGFISIEFGFVLLLIAFLIGGVVWLSMENMRKSKVNENITNIQLIAGNARATFGQRNQYSQVTTSVAVLGHIIPDVLRKGTGTPATAENTYGGAITLEPSTTAGALELTWGNVPNNVCSEVVYGTENVARALTVGTTTVKALDTNLSAASVITACNADKVTLVYTIGR